MLNIFNLFLFLFTLWLCFMLVGNNFNVTFLLFGIFSSTLVAVMSYQLKLIDKKSELLYLSLGFYRHFFTTYLKNFYTAISLLFKFALSKQSLHPTLHMVEFKNNFRFNPSLLIATINMTSGIFSIGIIKNKILVHAIHEDYFYNFDLLKNALNLNNINDDDLV